MTENAQLDQLPSEEFASDTDVRAIFKEHFTYVWNTVRRLGAKDADLEDLVHDVFLTFHRRRSSFDPTRPIKPWLFGIAFRVVSSHRKRAAHRREVASDSVEESPASERGAEEALDSKKRRDLVRLALLEVPEDRRAVLLLHDLDGVTMPEVVAALGIGLNTGYSRLRLARADFRAAVTRLSEEGNGR